MKLEDEMDVRYINPFLVATQRVLKTMLNLEPQMARPILKQERTASGEVTGVMGLSGDKKGAVAVSFTKKGALFIYNTLMGDNASEIGPEVVDAIGELTNIISGQARKELEMQGLNLKAAIPLVVTGKDLETSFITKLPIISLPFHFSVGNGEREIMYVDFSFE